MIQKKERLGVSPSTKLQDLYTRISHILPKEITVRNILVFCVLTLLVIGTVMVASASMPYAANVQNNPFYFLERHMISIMIAMCVAFVVSRFALESWFKSIFLLWLITIALLFVTFLIGTEVNGARRWIRLGFFTLQPTEVAKMIMAIFTADYVVRRASEVRDRGWMGLMRLALVMFVSIVLIILEPDFGSTAVIVMMMVGVFFLAGAPIKQFLVMGGVIVLALASLVIFEPYRLERLMSFSNPWADPLGAGYQLSNALMAFGRGEWFGVGLGHSMQKMSYLPEAHTDFMLAILGEEFGFFGIFTILTLEFLMLACCVRIGYRALKNNYLRAGYLAYGISFIFLMQILVNAGMNMGMLPTKGLTLPFISYGGSSLMMCAAMITLVLKIDASTQDENPTKELSNF
ncbi:MULTISPECIES: putative lipid II flippase FtsW [Acinetobacter]|jgi:cell division protein FtsW|uniref:Probable peptidoglycan glycosyltransferase FtsW n=1 Tax=Acinetobacter pollinis TaxID=2605270 RepID=A0ABU6DSD5_9GAMM|nr:MULTISPECIES: putative lipid II flippase FtsW [Acinetobacter]MBF7690018.1 putative lipid II flippase FtsW [Acinetobacter pollinis]MBF7692753.1 putative lipid II flippase FtsW [Acinetobacter pollinis]MBF7697778.1 putative lipid II flippase FtsW [Acinetobacter pollinis]MBF7700768.1 putative lipid II flippase FtsW [Acinetobacter pollinis]MEB5476756.1 putative lipid II flippase FtsW [Acinetobacter pollinis]